MVYLFSSAVFNLFNVSILFLLSRTLFFICVSCLFFKFARSDFNDLFLAWLFDTFIFLNILKHNYFVFCIQFFQYMKYMVRNCLLCMYSGLWSCILSFWVMSSYLFGWALFTGILWGPSYGATTKENLCLLLLGTQGHYQLKATLISWFLRPWW